MKARLSVLTSFTLVCLDHMKQGEACSTKLVMLGSITPLVSVSRAISRNLSGTRLEPSISALSGETQAQEVSGFRPVTQALCTRALKGREKN